MSERDMRTRVLRALKTAHAIPVENRALPGTPDVECRLGWLELKWLRAWPRRPETVVEVDHFTPQQRLWLRQRTRAGGRCWVLLQCRAQWLLLGGETAAAILGRVPRAELEARAVRVWNTGLKDEELLGCLLET